MIPITRQLSQYYFHVQRSMSISIEEAIEAVHKYKNTDNSLCVFYSYTYIKV